MNLPSDINSCHKLIFGTTKSNRTVFQRDGGTTCVDYESKCSDNRIGIAIRTKQSQQPQTAFNRRLRKTVALPKAKGKRTGGQKGHKGQTLQIVATPDVVEELLPTQCECGAVLVKRERKYWKFVRSLRSRHRSW